MRRSVAEATGVDGATQGRHRHTPSPSASLCRFLHTRCRAGFIAVAVAQDARAPAAERLRVLQSPQASTADARVHIVAHAVSIQVLGTIASADTEGVQLLAIQSQSHSGMSLYPHS